MRISVKSAFSQLLIILILISCRGGKDETVIPPATNPLSNEVIGYGVITDSFTHVTADPKEDSESLGYLRRSSVVRIIRRQTVKAGNEYQSWVLADDPQYGWLKEGVMDVYDTESKAMTASKQLAISN